MRRVALKLSTERPPRNTFMFVDRGRKMEEGDYIVCIIKFY